jgi:hypothetical protein
MAAAEIFVAEYDYLGLVGPADSANVPYSTVPTFSWEGIGYDEFKVSFSGDPAFPTLATSVFSSGSDVWTSQTSFAPTEQQWEAIREINAANGIVYWRVEGRDSEGSVSYTETRNFTIDEPKGSAIAAVQGNADDMSFGGGNCFINSVANSLGW